MAVAVRQLIMGSENGRNLHAFFEPRNGPIPASHKPDNSERRRKRQKIEFSNDRSVSILDAVTDVAPNDWENQLRAAAYGQHPSPDNISRTSSAANPESQEISTNAGNKSVGGPGDGNTDGTWSPSLENGTSGNNEAEMPLGIASERLAAMTPTKKMLTIRSDGKLRSPKTQEIHSGSNLKRRRRTIIEEKSREPVPRERIVILKYGLDDESRISIGHKIQEIYSGLQPNLIPEENMALKAPKLAETPRSTHPFFLGAGHRISSQKSAHCIDSKEDLKEASTETKQDAKNSPTKPNASARLSTNASAWASISGLGRNFNSYEISKVSRFPGAIEPIWPPKDMTHIRYPPEPSIISFHLRKRPQLAFGDRKMKYSEVQISEREEVLRPYVNLIVAEKNSSAKISSHSSSTLRRPRRKILTGFELQNAVHENIACKFPRPTGRRGLDCNEKDELSSSQPSLSPVHGALSHVHDDIATSLSAFDRFECETQDWVRKYAPKRAEEVLQPGREAMVLRDWLRSLTISSVKTRNGDSSKAQGSSTMSGKVDGKPKRKKRKRAEDLDDFLISSEDEADEMDELKILDEFGGRENQQSPSKRSVVRTENAGHGPHGQKSTNTVVISGPHGCGKTAAVYAAAEELGFEVFEINAGSRRNGKDVLDKVGDMTKNHLVNHAHGKERAPDTEQPFELSEALQQDIESGRQAAVNSFFKAREETKKKPKCKSPAQGGMSKGSGTTKKQHQCQKQSLILLEEVDLLFEEDKQFWTTTMDLIWSSKRPIIMTCTDENLLPLDEMLLYAILRFTAPPEHLAIDYLLLVACNEGHLLSRSAVSNLLKTKNYDLRASMMELNFFCQMAIGDTKGGLEWMLLRSSLNESRNEKGEKLRVVSDGTYLDGMGCFGLEWQDPDLNATFNEETELLSQIQDCRGIDIGDAEDFHCAKLVAATNPESREEAFQRLVALDQALDCVSAADTFPCSEFRDGNKAVLDTTTPKLAEKSKSNFIEGSTLLEANPIADDATIGTSLALALRVCARQLCRPKDIKTTITTSDQNCEPRVRTDVARKFHSPNQITRSTLSAAVHPIARPLKLSPAMQKGPYISSFDGPTSTIVEDLAPYVRSIVSYDLRLEEQRHQLNLLLSQGGRNGKRIRTTRASRAALEGGNKQDTRRERWFPPNTDFAKVMETGGIGWQDVPWQGAPHQANVVSGESKSRRSSLASMASSGS